MIWLHTCIIHGFRFNKLPTHLPKLMLLSRQFSKRVDTWKIKLRDTLENYSDLDLRFIRITDHGYGASFTDTPLKYRGLKVPDDANVVLGTKFSAVFGVGFRTLHSLAYSGVLETSDSPDALCSLAALTEFLTDMQKEEKTLKDGFIKYGKDISETSVAALLTNHLLSCLVYGNHHMISNDYRDKPNVCPCTNVDCRTDIKYGHTGPGTRTSTCQGNQETDHAVMWHSRPNVMIIPRQGDGCMVPVWYINDPPEEDTEDTEDIPPLENRSKSKFKTLASHVVSQAVTFSFYQSSVMRERGVVPLTSLVPSLILTPSHYYIILYDHENDILLSSGNCDSLLWSEGGECKFNLSAILHIWMVLNYRDCVPKLDPAVEHHLRKSSNVHSILESQNLLKETNRIVMRDSLPCDTGGEDADEANGFARDIKEYLKHSHSGKLWN